MPDYAPCMYCHAPLPLDGRSYDCSACNTRWVPHDLAVSESVQEKHQEMIESRLRAKERREAWNSLSIFERAAVALGLREFDPELEHDEGRDDDA